MKYHVLWILAALVLFCCAAPVCGAGPAVSSPDAGYITVTNPVTADFFTSTRYGGAPLTVSFSDRSFGAEPRTYLWEFGDGATSTQENPTHTYLKNGEYTVRLTVTNQYGSNTLSRAAYIGAGNPPEPDFTVPSREGIAPFTVPFSDTSKNVPTNWSWDFGDGSTESVRNPIHVYNRPGNYSVSLLVSNPYGSNSVSRAGLIRVNAPAPAVQPNQTPVSEEMPKGFIDLIRDAKGSTAAKNLPTAGIIPPELMAIAAVLTSLGVVLVQFLLANISTLSQFAMKGGKFLLDITGGHAVEKLSEKEITARRIAARKLEQHIFGFSSMEILVIEVAVIMVALAFILADRAELTLETVLIYIVVGAISVVLHDFAHRYFATRHGHDADTRFWGLGTVIMFLTAWLYGSAFAQSYRNLVNREGEDEPRELGIEMMAGPLVSIILMFLFLAMMTFGGLWAVAGGLGFTINLITAVYSLIPIETMDGLAIWRWNRPVYLVIFLPLLGFYLFTYVFV
ncbi:PKD domain-containing protein [Methanoregula sp.]|uniref:PKD domain-containing protein n=1 Tax=Methanoregula sp. TaxID=2052170 RepID=UPI003569355F